MVVVPPPLEPGALVWVVAPSSPFEHVLAWRGLGWLAERYRVRFDRGLFSRRGYLAGDDARRREELSRALVAPGVRAILAARGGYGLSRIVADLDVGALVRSPRWVVGFSDVTALHIECARVGVASLHAAHVTSLGRGDARAREAFRSALEAPAARRELIALDTWRPGTARGPLFGGNLTLLHATAAAGRLAVPPGSVLLLEDVGERPYRLDRMLTTLALGGHLRDVAAVLLGDFTECAPGADGVTWEEVLRDRLLALGVPVVAGAPVGHGARNTPVVLGLEVHVEAGPAGARVVQAGTSP